MFDFYDTLEWQTEQDREGGLMERLPSFVKFATEHSRYYRAHFDGIDLDSIVNRERLITLPLTRKSDLGQLQQRIPPLAGIVPNMDTVGRLFQSPGPICEPENTRDDWWGLGRAFYAAGFRQGDLVQNCLSYHMSPGGFILDSGARACGCTVIPAGPGNTEQQLDLIEQLAPTGYCGTPSFLKILLDKGLEQNRDMSSLRNALVTGEAYTTSLQQRFKLAGINARQAYATADLGLIAYETILNQGLVLAEDLIVEIVRPGTGIPVGIGEIGEVVVTRFNPEYPLIRFATGDLSSILPTPSACGRTNIRIAGWQGRADQSAKVKGLFVHPQQLERLRKRFDGIELMRLEITAANDNDQMKLRCELRTEQTSLDSDVIAAELKSVTKLTGSVELVPPRGLPRDGIIIEDLR